MPMRRKSIGLAVTAAAAVGLFDAAAAAAMYCNEPTAPWVPTPSWADQATLEKADADIRTYNQAVTDYISCLQAAIAAADAQRNDVLEQWTWTINNLPQQ